MCDAVAIALAALSIGGTYMGIQQQNSAAEATARNANEALRIDYDLLNKQEHQTDVAASEDAFQRERQGMRDLAKLRVAQGESGALGNTSLRELNASMLQTSMDVGVMESNKDNTIDQLEMQKLNTRTTAGGRINQARATVVNPFYSSLKIGPAGLSGYSSGLEITRGKSRKTTVTYE